MDDLAVLAEDSAGVLRRERLPALGTGGQLGLLNVEVEISDADLAARQEGWTAPPPKYTRGVLGKYAKVVQSAAHGAVTS